MDFKKADEKIRAPIVHVDLSEIDNAPVDRNERINFIYAVILDGENKYNGYNLQRLINKFTIVYGAQRKTVIDYFKTLDRAGYTYVDSKLKVRPLRENNPEKPT